MHWVKDNWFKILLLVIIGWFAYSYIQTQRFNSYVECNTELMKVASSVSETPNVNWYPLCDVGYDQKFTSNIWKPVDLILKDNK